MTIKEAIKTVMKETKTTQNQLADMTGLNGNSAVSMALSKDTRISTIIKFVEAMGYEVVIQKKLGRRAEGQYVVEGKERTDNG